MNNTNDLQNIPVGTKIIISLYPDFVEEVTTIVEVDARDEILPYFTSRNMWVGPNDIYWKVLRVA